MFKTSTYEEMQPYSAADRLFAVVRCEAVEIRSVGSRSERQDLRGKVLAGPPGMAPGSTLLLSRYAQGALLMIVDRSYVVAAYREAATGPWTLLEHLAVRPADSARELESAEREAERRLSP